MRKQIAKIMFLWFVVLFGVVSLVLPGLVLAVKYGGTLVVLVLPEPPILASYLSTSGPVAQISCKIYEGLLEFDFDHNPLPGLAKSVLGVRHR